MNTIIKKFPYNNVSLTLGRSKKQEMVIIYPPDCSIVRSLTVCDPNNTPLAPAVLINNDQSTEEGETKSTFHPFHQSIYPRFNHISYGSLTVLFFVFVGMVVSVKKFMSHHTFNEFTITTIVKVPHSQQSFILRLNELTIFWSISAWRPES